MGQVLDALLSVTPDEVAKMQPHEQAAFAATLRRELALRSPADFAVEYSRGSWEPYKHAVYMSDAIVDMIEHDTCDLLIIEVTVRHGKTELCSRWTPAWFECKYPDRRTLLASYEADFAATHGRRVREIVNEVGEQYGVKIDDTSRAANRWDIDGHTGGMGTAGANGPITGKGGHLLIVDDPIKNSEEAGSLVMRDKLWEWWSGTWITRREPGAKMILVMSRWHEDDLTARVKKHAESVGGMRVRTIRLPAIAEEGDELGRRPGDPLCPERYDENALAGIRADVGPGPWMSLYQQRPTPAGGGMFKRDWLRYWDAEVIDGDTFLRLGDTRVMRDEIWKFATMDVAYTKSKRSDYTVVGVWGVAPTDPPSLVLLDMQRRRVTHADHAPLIQEAWNTWRPAWVGVEKQMATLSLFDEVQRNGVVVRWLKPDKHKVARAETAAALMEAGRIWVPKEAAWFGDFLEELMSFPVGKHDDMVDVLAYAAGELSSRAVHPRRMKHELTDPSDIMWEKMRKRQQANRHHPVLGRWP